MSIRKTGPLFSGCPPAAAPRPDTPVGRLPADARVTITVEGDEETYGAVRLTP
ncbi:hypothetical protein [Streptomyces roseochromogenus]|uniref:hypothetical protein n=1 Tax=Streptomyces roseochromogenus TaxID=285450 RepID=UPI00131A39E4|nr:hypothetical protein [Streptomyces roseochromogenus]